MPFKDTPTCHSAGMATKGCKSHQHRFGEILVKQPLAGSRQQHTSCPLRSALVGGKGHLGQLISFSESQGGTQRRWK
jgi:hypothetical protein